jgi:hypothetical protein
MNRILYFLLCLITLSLQGQVGINTQNPETTFEVVGKPDDLNHYDGIIPPRITGDQLAAKFYSSTKKGAIVFVTSAPSNLAGQVIHVLETGLYYFDGNIWKSFEDDTLEDVVGRGNYSPKYISFIGSAAYPLRDGALGMNENTYSMYFGNMNPNHTGNYNIGFGYGSLENITTSTYSTAIGSFAGQKTTSGNANSFFGDEAGTNNTVGHKNSLFGMAAAYHNKVGSFNSIFGYKAGQFRNLGNYNILIGNSAGSSSGTEPVTNLGNNHVFIGTAAGFGDLNLNNKLIIHSNNSLRAIDYNSVTSDGVFINPGLSSLSNALVTGDFLERWFKLNGKLIVNPSQLESGNDYTKIIVSKTDGTFGWEEKNSLLSVPIPPNTGNYLLKSVSGVMQWIAE